MRGDWGTEKLSTNVSLIRAPKKLERVGFRTCFSFKLQHFDCSTAIANMLLVFEYMIKFFHFYSTEPCFLQFWKYVGSIPWDHNSFCDKMDMMRDLWKRWVETNQTNHPNRIATIGASIFTSISMEGSGWRSKFLSKTDFILFALSHRKMYKEHFFPSNAKEWPNLHRLGHAQHGLRWSNHWHQKILMQEA